MKPLVIVGAGGFGREVFEIIRALHVAGVDSLQVEGFVDDSPSSQQSELLDRLGARLLGPVEYLLHSAVASSVVLAVGNPFVRRALAARLVPARPHYPVLVHPDATVGGDVELGPGTVVCPGARLSTHITIGQHVHVDQNATVGHDTTIGDYSRLNPQACISGSVIVGAGTVVGANATVLQRLSIGENATVGAGAVVLADVSPGAVVKGVPAR